LWKVTDEYDSSSISATATIPTGWAWQVPLSTDVTVSGDADPSHPTVSWKNIAGSYPPQYFDGYRLRVVLASDITKLLWETDIPRSPSVTCSIPYAFEPGVGYAIRIEARKYWYFPVSGTGLENILAKDANGNPLAGFLNRSTVFINYVYPILVEIDIKPGSDPNSINLRSKGVVPVSVLTTDDFDATKIDPSTVFFADAPSVRWTMCDIDQDGDQDMLFHFTTQELNLNEDSAEATLTGYMEGKLFEGTDSVRIVPMPK
jgi:hypothetical protein